ncbi:sigma-70 family RNA polymerase sigma factor [Mucilaginibacter sabulilitoris]|uniref:Sigma-70 family RNA polymerase sigma factor n=1 Tax=Mucilaginibacter sabulilitoris TaxID=1173583 RepID=A0ABZ0TVF0_9SPHI|nr:sigma-70 family RNA polymerase sigma factor [Mucilaginibacter sabulilitoris]WPU97063.1 sigma-70 family RNA polymerase sigma factor [Mucilaginibacter sabulilitoris]
MKTTGTIDKEQIFKTIYLATFDKLNKTLNSIKNDELVHDAIQEAYLKLWVKMDEQEEQEDYMPFLYFYARNYAIKQISRNIKRELLEGDIFREANGINLEHELEFKEYHLQLSQAVNRLPTKRREVYRLFKEEGLSYKSIGKKLHISYKTVDNHLTKATRAIKYEIRSIYGITKLIVILLLFLLGR